MHFRAFCAAPCAFLLALAACSSTPHFNQGDAGGGGPDAAFQEGGGQPSAVGTLSGRVFAPEGTIPISGALVYVTDTAPPPIPDGVYCDTCVTLPSSVAHVFTNPDGTFALPAYSTGTHTLVVQKGQFRRVRSLDIVGGAQGVPKQLTTLPGAMDKVNGDDIPKMAIAKGAWDAIETSLGKLGMQPGSFDVYEGKFPPQPATDPYTLLSDHATISKYHIVFIPCTSSNGTDCTGDTTSGVSAVQSNLKSFVGAGGKLYVTDYSYEYVRQPWPGYVDWVGETSQIGSACQTSEYDAPATIQDPGLSSWLSAIGVSSVTLQANWTTIDKVNTVQLSPNVSVTPTVWVMGQTPSGLKPSTVSFQSGCGRVLFSTYHTEALTTQLLPQEQALLYVLLEVAVCVETPQPN